jgi:dihydrolipoamide dehydrogenase
MTFKKCMFAAGSQAVRLPFMPNAPRVVDSTGALELQSVPKRMLILGGGIIGLEMGTVYSTLGARLDLVKIWQKMNAKRFDNIMLKTKTKTVSARALPEGTCAQSVYQVPGMWHLCPRLCPRPLW